MTRILNIILFVFFLISGFCSLLYQVVWLRMAFASFGIITPVLSVVISVFMLGLAVGSIAGGRWISRLVGMTNISAIFFYAVAEFFIGVSAFAVPELFRLSETVLSSVGQMNSFNYLFISGVLTTLSLLPWCTMMGLTFPFMMSFLKETDETNRTSFSFLYLANVIGAMFGTLITALVLVELVGFRKTLLLSAILNFIIAAAGTVLGLTGRRKKRLLAQDEAEIDSRMPATPLIEESAFFILSILFITGFTSMSMEVIWVRAFTPIFGTSIYSFAFILAVYLFATWAGSYYYRINLKRNKIARSPTLLIALSVASFFPVLFPDPRLGMQKLLALASIFPFCLGLGYLTPKLIDRYSEGNPYRAGKAYAVNIAGCIAGPIMASYLFLPLLGVRISMIAFALPYAFFFISHARTRRYRTAWSAAATILIAGLFAFSTFISKSHEEILGKSVNSILRRDHTATVIASGRGANKNLLVNGIGITAMTPVTKMMAHLPISFLDRKPESALMICFGMGTTYRSLLSWDIKTTAVELIPSVKDVFGFFHEDAGRVLSNPKGKIIIDDGRRFLRRSREMFDIITIDPPPPPEAAGSSLLYSEEFYGLIKTHLKKGGVFQQWFPGGDLAILKAVARSIVNSFPYVRSFISVAGKGVHFIASSSPLETPNIDDLIARMPGPAKKDFSEWAALTDIKFLYTDLLSREIPLSILLTADRNTVITDDRPFNEYYFLRRSFGKYKNF